MDFKKGQSWLIPHDHLALLGTITTGKFAKICQATIRSRSEQVVAKMLKDGYTSDDEIFMRAKVNYNATVVGKDPNVLEFIGAVVDNEVLGPVLILEYCEQGQLDKWLLKQRGDINDDTIEILQRIAFDVCKGMAYLASKKIVHQKLAARNVLLTFTRVAKVAGFGPSKPEKETINHYDNASNAKKERIPIKWTAPECLVSLKDANEKSDVWSYGIVLWEIFSLGETPYNDMKSRDVETKVKSGYRMSKPEICEDFHYDVMKNCWEENPKKRHSFKTIKGHIAKTFSTNTRDSVYYYK
ncbi:megakaryocyte-associated tyrosine-protein kinase [Patella vulgata]|uniref:megakaryocyte-associated tyrosine-protein kinase n=1 Tax=Patella vulgata TaxID=6465 RepID=UPI0024A97FFE|nr:megakaryocyte-associated tyrosine-protein kinase [Patella vulgata]